MKRATGTITIKDYPFDVYAFYEKSEKPLPAFLYYMHIKECNAYNIAEIPIKDIAERGFAVIVLNFWKNTADIKKYIKSTKSPETRTFCAFIL